MKTFANRIFSFARDRQGVAFLEFALILPLLLLLLLGGVEISRYIQASQKADKLAHVIVDLVAQSPTISTQDLARIVQAARHVMQPHDFTTNGTVILSCVGYDSNGRLTIKWQYRGGGNLVRSSLIGARGNSPALPPGFTLEAKDNVIVSEVFFRFTPLISENIATPADFYRTAYYLPRLGELDTLIVN